MVEPNSPGCDNTSIKSAMGICFAILLVSCAARLFGQAGGEIIRLDPKLDEIVSSDARVEKLAGGFGFVEGPVWVRRAGICSSAIFPRTRSINGRLTARLPCS